METKSIRKKDKHLGFSLVELLVAVFIFSLVFTASVSVFLSVFRSQNNIKVIQQGIENSRTAIELMAKNIRMGAIDSATSDNIYFYNYSQKKCINYTLANNKIKYREASVSRISQPNCLTAGFSPLQDLVSVDNIESLKFNAIKSDYGDTNPSIGRVTIVIEVSGSNEPIQTTISLRDYLD